MISSIIIISSFFAEQYNVQLCRRNLTKTVGKSGKILGQHSVSFATIANIVPIMY